MNTPALPEIVIPGITVTAGQRYAIFSPTLADGAVAPMDYHATWTTSFGRPGITHQPASGHLHWRAGNAYPDVTVLDAQGVFRPMGSDIVVAMGPDSLSAKPGAKGQYFQIHIHLGPPIYGPDGLDLYGWCDLELQAIASRPAVWSMPMDQASLDAIRPTTTATSKLPRSTFGGYDVDASETGVDIYNGQVPSLSPFVVGSDKRVHLRCVPLPSPIKTSQGKMASIGQARLIAPTMFAPGDLVEWDVQHVTPGWLITWTTGEFGWPAGGEIDMEYRPDWCATPQTLNLVQHYPGASNAGLGGVTPVGVDLTKLHVRSLEWLADGKTIVARINGVEVQRWPMLWNGQPQIIVTQATAYLPYEAGMAMPELSLGSWVHYKPKAA